MNNSHLNSAVNKSQPLIIFIIKHNSSQEDEALGISAFRHIDKDGQVLLRALLKGMISHTLACRHTSLAHTDSDGLPGATHSMNICDWTGQEEGEADCLSDEDRVVYADHGVWQPLRLQPPQYSCRGCRVNPHSQLYPTGTGCARTGLAVRAELH